MLSDQSQVELLTSPIVSLCQESKIVLIYPGPGPVPVAPGLVSAPMSVTDAAAADLPMPGATLLMPPSHRSSTRSQNVKGDPLKDIHLRSYSFHIGIVLLWNDKTRK